MDMLFEDITYSEETFLAQEKIKVKLNQEYKKHLTGICLFSVLCWVFAASTKAVFCGHDHYNNMSLEYKGIRLTYGMSIDYLAMPGIEHDTAQRGAELITLHADGTFDLVQIPLTLINE